MNTNFDERNLNFDELLQELEQKPQLAQTEPAATLDPLTRRPTGSGSRPSGRRPSVWRTLRRKRPLPAARPTPTI